METGIKVLYRYAQATLYAICRFAWALYGQYVENFATISAKYDEQYGTDALAAVDAAEALPDLGTRRGALTSMSDDLKTVAGLCIDCFSLLMGYIEDAFSSPVQVAAMKQQAGAGYYEKAYAGSMTDLTAMMKNATDFVAANTDILLKEGKGMPKAFPDTLNGNNKSFTGMLTKYTAAKKSTEEATDAKVTANNAVYTSVMSLFKDAKKAFKKNKPVQASFTYKAIKKLVNPSTKTGIQLSVKDSVTKKGVASADVVTDAEEEVRKTNKRGVLNLRLASGTHTIVITMAGYQTLTTTVQVEAGMVHRKPILLKKIVAAAEAVV